MIEQIQSYIAACEANLAKYQQIEDPVERERAVAACEGMLADFKALIEKSPSFPKVISLKTKYLI